MEHCYLLEISSLALVLFQGLFSRAKQLLQPPQVPQCVVPRVSTLSKGACLHLVLYTPQGYFDYEMQD